MNPIDRQAYIDYRFDKADETMEVAKILMEHEKWNSAMN